jgi:cytoskeleton protein RodZ
MSEVPFPPAVANNLAAPPQTAGQLLRTARERAGLHVAALAVSMKVPVKKLEALEADRLDLLPDAVFVRALASSVCRTLKVDAAPVLNLLPQTAVPKLGTVVYGINAPFHASGDFKNQSLSGLVKKPAAALVILLLIGAVAIVLVPEVQFLKPSADSQPDAKAVAEPVMPPEPAIAAPAEAQSVLQSKPELVPAIAEPVTQAVKPAAIEQAPSLAPAPSTKPAPSPEPALFSVPVSVSAASPKPAPAVAVGSDASGAATGILVLRFKGDSWVEVMDAKGVVQVRRILLAGETVAASGTLPLAVVIGRADVTEAEVRGKPFSLAGVSKDNVARFEVK